MSSLFSLLSFLGKPSQSSALAILVLLSATPLCTSALYAQGESSDIDSISKETSPGKSQQGENPHVRRLGELLNKRKTSSPLAGDLPLGGGPGLEKPQAATFSEREPATSAVEKAKAAKLKSEAARKSVAAKKIGADKAVKKKKHHAKKRPTQRVELFYLYTPMSPVAFHRLLYSAPTSDHPSTLWSAGQKQSSALLGLGLKWQMALPHHLRLELGLRVRAVAGVVTQADYDDRVAAGASSPAYNLYAQTTQKITSYGTFADLYYRPLSIPGTRHLFYLIGGGIDLDYSKIDFSSDYHDENSPASTRSLVSGSSSLDVLSLRFVNSLVYTSGRWATSLGLNLLKPIYEFDRRFNFSSSNDEAVLLGSGSEKSNVQSALGQEKTSLGVEVMIGFGRSF